VFVRVVETGSFSAAARDLRMGQPAVSKTIAGLETRLGVRLLVRTSRRLSPTEAGEAYYERARRTLTEADEAETAARGLGSGLEGRLRVCAPVTFGRLHVAPKLGAFLDAHPKLRLELIMDDRRINLLEENIDIALRAGALSDSTEISVRVPSRLAFSAAEGLREGVLAGLGLAIAPRWMFSPELESGAVVPILRDWSLPPVDLWAVHPAGRMPSAKARAFISWYETVKPD